MDEATTWVTDEETWAKDYLMFVAEMEVYVGGEYLNHLLHLVVNDECAARRKVWVEELSRV